MIKWGSIEIPELEYVPHTLDNPPNVGVTHLPTGLRLARDLSVFERDVMPQYLLYVPGVSEPQLRIHADQGRYITVDVEDYLRKKDINMDDIGWDVAVRQFRHEVGETIGVKLIEAESATEFQWTVERRDALVAMCFWLLSGAKHPAKEGPVPGEMVLQRTEVPEVFRGRFQNPFWIDEV